MYRNDHLTVTEVDGGLSLSGEPAGFTPEAVTFILDRIPEGGVLELFVRDPALQAAVNEHFGTRTYIRTARRGFALDAARFRPDYRLASAYTLREEENTVAIFRDTARVSRCEWDEEGRLTFETIPGYQEMGLATVCGRVAVGKLLEWGIAPTMVCRRHQFPAAALAARLGFAPAWEEQIYGLRREEVPADGTS